MPDKRDRSAMLQQAREHLEAAIELLDALELHQAAAHADLALERSRASGDAPASQK